MNKIYLVFLMPILLTITGCNQTKEVLGFNRQINDEFSVARSAPLTLPPNYNQLPEPKKNQSRSESAANTTNTAKDLAFSSLSKADNANTSSQSKAEVTLLSQASSSDSDKDIRAQLDREATIESKKGESFVTKILSFRDEDSGKTLDPQEEQKRLLEQQKNDAKKV